MFRKLKNVLVKLNTPQGTVFSGRASGVEMRTADGVIAINPRAESYLHLTQTTRITLRCGTDFHSFALENAAASLRGGQLTILAQTIRQVQPAATEASDPRV